MKYLKSYTQINETLKSDEIEIVDKKISNFFDKLGFNKNGKSPHYSIHSDRNSIKNMIKDYKNKLETKPKYFLKSCRDSKITLQQIEGWVKGYEDKLKSFKYGDIFIFTYKNSPEITKNLLHLIESVGYFVASIGKDIKMKDKSKIYETLSKQNTISISIEPYYDSDPKFEGEYLYHVTNKVNIGKIMKMGLSPKSKNTRSFYPDRIYLSPNIEYMDSIKDQLKGDKPGEYVCLKIKRFPGLKLYNDVRFKGGFYTYDNIDPKYITIVD